MFAGSKYFSVNMLVRLAAATCLCLAAATTSSAQTATYSDSWFINNSGTEYDSETDEWMMPETPSTTPNQVAGVGVTEADYYSDSESVETTLTAPDGRTATYTNYADPWYSRSEVTLTIDKSEDPTEYEWSVNTVHSYWREETEEPCSTRLPCYQAKAAPRRLWYFYRVFSYYQIWYGIAMRGYTNPLYTNRGPFNFGPMGCRYRTPTCDSNCRNPTTWVTWNPPPCPPNAQAWYLTWRTFFVRGCILIDAIALFSPPRCTPRTWPG